MLATSSASRQEGYGADMLAVIYPPMSQPEGVARSASGNRWAPILLLYRGQITTTEIFHVFDGGAPVGVDYVTKRRERDECACIKRRKSKR